MVNFYSEIPEVQSLNQVVFLKNSYSYDIFCNFLRLQFSLFSEKTGNLCGNRSR